MQQAQRQREAVAEIRKVTRWVGYDWEFDESGNNLLFAQRPGPVWLRGLLGDDFFQSVVGVAEDLEAAPFTDADLEHLQGLHQLRRLNLMNAAKITDAGLEHLKGLKQLQMLILNGSNITDAGLEHLKGLKQLHDLTLGNTKVTPAGLKKLQQALRSSSR